MHWVHTSSTGGHPGRYATLKKLQGLFYWKGLIKDVQNYIRNCTICQACKYDTAASPGLLQPLPIPTTVWQDIAMDFIEGLPKSFGKQVIFVVVDRLSKYAYFIALAHPYTTVEVAQAYLDHVFKNHGWPRSIVSDRDSIFVSNFWQALFTLQGTDLLLSSSYHPQTDGQTEVLNRCLETYLRCMTSDEPKEWSKWLPVAQWWHNTTYHSATQLTPYEILYNQAPPIHLPYLPSETNNEAVDRSLQRREAMIHLLKFHLLHAQHRMKLLANQHRSERSFAIGEQVWLKLQPYRQHSVYRRTNDKLNPRYFGPFQVKRVIGKVAYQLDLPTTAQVHNVFHVSQIKCFRGELPAQPHIPVGLQGNDNSTQFTPAAILERKLVKQHNKAVVFYLVLWEGQPESEATWEEAAFMEERFPQFFAQSQT